MRASHLLLLHKSEGGQATNRVLVLCWRRPRSRLRCGTSMRTDVLSNHCNFPPFSNGQSVHQAASHLGVDTIFCSLTWERPHTSQRSHSLLCPAVMPTWCSLLLTWVCHLSFRTLSIFRTHNHLSAFFLWTVIICITFWKKYINEQSDTGKWLYDTVTKYCWPNDKNWSILRLYQHVSLLDITNIPFLSFIYLEF